MRPTWSERGPSERSIGRRIAAQQGGRPARRAASEVRASEVKGGASPPSKEGGSPDAQRARFERAKLGWFGWVGLIGLGWLGLMGLVGYVMS